MKIDFGSNRSRRGSVSHSTRPSLRGAVHVVLRIRRLALPSAPAGRAGAKRGRIAVTIATVLVLAQVGALSVITVKGVSSEQALHALCHLPHVGSAAA